jgi:signal peptide peptidase SppA
MSVTEKLTARLPMSRGTTKPVVAVVKLHGVITPTPSPLAARGTININTVEQALTKAFDHERLKAVAVAINSPGGAPTQSALVGERIRELADRKKVPVIAFCEDVAASGGYWLACAADEIYAHSSSLVGSIGVVTAGFGLNGLLERVGVERRVYTAGEKKMMLDPFQPENADDVERLQALQQEIHRNFQDWVRERRGVRLRGLDSDLFSGEFWSGTRAAQLGLVVGIDDLRSHMRRRFGDTVRLRLVSAPTPWIRRWFGPHTDSMAPPRLLPESWADDLVSAVEARALWSRFGL